MQQNLLWPAVYTNYFKWLCCTGCNWCCICLAHACCGIEECLVSLMPLTCYLFFAYFLCNFFFQFFTYSWFVFHWWFLPFPGFTSIYSWFIFSSLISSFSFYFQFPVVLGLFINIISSFFSVTLPLIVVYTAFRVQGPPPLHPLSWHEWPERWCYIHSPSFTSQTDYSNTNQTGSECSEKQIA